MDIKEKQKLHDILVVGIVCCSFKETRGMSEEALCFPLKYHTH
jgi:hypothetical protein